MKDGVKVMMAEMSKQAYCDPAGFVNPAMSFAGAARGEVAFFTDPATDAQAYGAVLELEGVATPVLVYRGTSSVWDAAQDCHVRITQVPFADEGVWAHSGFLHDVLALRPQTDEWLAEVAPSKGTLLCTGHSLGSANSAIAALAYGYAGFHVSWMGFGTPRPGNADFALAHARLVVEAIECQNRFDPVVSCIPPVKYRRVGTHVQLGTWDPFPDVCVPACIADHDMGAYLQCVRAGDIVTNWHSGGIAKYLIQAPSALLTSFVSLYYLWH